MPATKKDLEAALRGYFPTFAAAIAPDSDNFHSLVSGFEALQVGTLSWARLNQIMHRCSQAGASEGFFEYYFLKIPLAHPYPVIKVFADYDFALPGSVREIRSLEQLQWGMRRFLYDAILYWGNIRQAYRDLRGLSYNAIEDRFAARRINEAHILNRGTITEPIPITQDHRYLISETACKTYEASASPAEASHVKLALDAFRQLRAEGKRVTSQLLREATEKAAKEKEQQGLFELMYEDAQGEIETEDAVIALYAGQWEAFSEARKSALENTKRYLSICNDLDVYVATSMRTRQDFREMAQTCDLIFKSPSLAKYNIRYFDPTLSAADYHEDKGIIECLMVKTCKAVLYFSQHKESLGKVSEYAMGLTLGKPVIVLCPDDKKGREMYAFYKQSHPLTRLVEFSSGVVSGAMITHQVSHVVTLLERILTNAMEYDLAFKDNQSSYYLLKERLTGSTVRVLTDNSLLTETFWNNWHGIH